jgi:hypothetical protein
LKSSEALRLSFAEARDRGFLDCSEINGHILYDGELNGNSSLPSRERVHTVVLPVVLRDVLNLTTVT